MLFSLALARVCAFTSARFVGSEDTAPIRSCPDLHVVYYLKRNNTYQRQSFDTLERGRTSRSPLRPH